MRLIDGAGAVLLDAGGVLVLPDPTVLAPLLVYYGGSTDLDDHRRAHYEAMKAKAEASAAEKDWVVYNRTYVESIGVGAADRPEAEAALAGARYASLWRWPIPQSVVGLRALAERGVPMGVVSNASGQVERDLARSGICQVGPGPHVEMRCIIDSAVVGVEKPHPAIFDLAMEFFPELASARDRVLFVGDSLTMDIEGASAAGMQPVLIDPYDCHSDCGVRRIRTLSDLLV